MYSLDLGSHLVFAVHGNADKGGMAGRVDAVLSSVEHLISLSPQQIFAELMPGIAALPNVHPLLVHFPIALLTLFFVVELLGFLLHKSQMREVANWLLYLGTFFAVLTVAAGLNAASTVAHGDDVHDIMEHHEHLGISVLSLAAMLSAWRFLAHSNNEGIAKITQFGLAAILALLITFTADLGGLMVYGYGVAVRPVANFNQEAIHAHQHSQPDADVSANPQSPQPGEAVGQTSDPTEQSVHTHADGSQHVHKHSH